MRKPQYILNKATGDESAATNASTSSSDGSFSWTSLFGLDGEGPYAFKTLWKEATKAVGHIMTAITNISITRNTTSALNAQTYWGHSKVRADYNDSNIGFYAILAVVLIAALVIFIVNNKYSE